jgi:hypothetical protein
MKASGYLLVIAALVLVFLGVLLLPYALLASLNAERIPLSLLKLQALYLAEAGAQEAIALIQANPTNPAYPSQPIPVCHSSTPCHPSQADYVGRYCYSQGSLGGLSCSVLRTVQGGEVRFNIEAVGESNQRVARVRVVYNQSTRRVELWEVGP